MEQPRTENATREENPNRRRDKKKKSCEKKRRNDKRTAKKEKAQKQLTYGKARTSLINMANGLRTMNIASLNPDSMKEEQMQRDIIKDLTRNKIHIAAIQETHIIQDRDYLLDNYITVS